MRNRRNDVISYDVVEETRLKFGLTKKAFSQIMGFKQPAQYYNCEKKGIFIAYRFYAAIDALENRALKRAFNEVVALQNAKRHLNLVDD